jgi:hypothetical protein
MPATPAQLEAVVSSAKFLLGARQDEMVTLDEWVALARAVAACTGQKTADLLTERDFVQARHYEIPWDEATDGRLPNSDED